MFVPVDANDGCSVPQLSLESETAGEWKWGLGTAASWISAYSPQKGQAGEMQSPLFCFASLVVAAFNAEKTMPVRV